jgi:hypothetical protein
MAIIKQAKHSNRTEKTHVITCHIFQFCIVVTQAIQDHVKQFICQKNQPLEHVFVGGGGGEFVYEKVAILGNKTHWSTLATEKYHLFVVTVSVIYLYQKSSDQPIGLLYTKDQELSKVISCIQATQDVV